MGVRTYLVEAHQANQQKIISAMQRGEEVFLRNEATEAHPEAVAVRNHDRELCGFLDGALGHILHRRSRNLENIHATVYRVQRDREGCYRCEIKLDISSDSAIAREYECAVTGESSGQPHRSGHAGRRRGFHRLIASLLGMPSRRQR